MFRFDSDTVLPIMVFSIPILAIVGGIVAGIVKTLGRQRLAELAQRERIAAIERGIDPAKLPAMPGILDADDDLARLYMTPAERSQKQYQGLMIAGIITLAAGAGFMAFLSILAGGERAWAVGLVPVFVGVALLLSAWLVKPRGNGAGHGAPPRAG
jgi:hypothetical protein